VGKVPHKCLKDQMEAFALLPPQVHSLQRAPLCIQAMIPQKTHPIRLQQYQVIFQPQHLALIEEGY